jgi:6-phosphogluconolactonase
VNDRPEHLLLAACPNDAGLVALSLDATQGVLSEQGRCDSIPSAHFVVPLSPGRGALLLHDQPNARQDPSGRVSLLRSVGQGPWQVIAQAPTGGSTPCNASMTPDGRQLWVANFRDVKSDPAGKGCVGVLELDAEASCAELLARFEHEGSGRHTQRQTCSHPHCTAVDPSGRFVAVCDLGTDSVYVYAREAPRPRRLHALRLDALTGPRHCAFDPTGKTLYVITEISNVLYALSLCPESGRLAVESACPLVEANRNDSHSGADVAVSPDGRSVYGSLRAQNAVAFVRDGRCLQQIRQGIGQPRAIALSPDGLWLVSGNLSHATLSVHRVGPDGLLSDPVHTLEGIKACGLAFAPCPTGQTQAPGPARKRGSPRD